MSYLIGYLASGYLAFSLFKTSDGILYLKYPSIEFRSYGLFPQSLPLVGLTFAGFFTPGFNGSTDYFIDWSF